MFTTPFGCAIVGAAHRSFRAWHDRKCPPERTNSGECVDDVHKDFFWLLRTTGQTTDNLNEAEPWCAELVSLILHEAAKSYGIAPAHTHSVMPVSRSAIGFLQSATKYGLRVDSKPAVGAVFWRPRKGGTGHVGIVVAVAPGKIGTIEGNSRGTIRRTVKSTSELANYRFLHTEERFGTSLSVCSPNIYNWWEWAMMSIGTASFMTAGLLAYRYYRNNYPHSNSNQSRSQTI